MLEHGCDELALIMCVQQLEFVEHYSQDHRQISVGDCKRSGHNMDILLQSKSGVRVTAFRLRIRIYESNGLYEGANPCTFLVGSPVREEKYPYCVQVF